MSWHVSLSAVILVTVVARLQTDAAGREKRADDSDPMRPVVEQLTQQVQQLQAEFQAMKTNVDDLKTPIGFTVRMKNSVTGLGPHQIVKFDDVIYNAGNGYSTGTGLFIVPSSGTYILMLKTMRHRDDDPTIMLDVMRNGVILAHTHAGYSPYDNGNSGLYVVHLDHGDIINVERNQDGGSQFLGGFDTVFSGLRVMP